MWEDFQKEQFNRHTLNTSEGFVVYNVYADNSLYIHIMYVKPSCRGGKASQRLENTLIDSYNPKCVYCYVDLDSNNPDVSMGCILSAGYSIDEVQPHKIILKKVLND